MRSLLQLRTPEIGDGPRPDSDSLATADIPNDASPRVRFREAQIEMAHGAGGKASRRLVEGLFAPLLYGTSDGPLGDAAHVSVGGSRVAITTDSFVVNPLSFAGGSIGELAVNGTVNDLAVSGARAEALVVTYILEAGLPTQVLETEVRAMAKAARLQV
jgi:hydrogenase expression/formation protein HypE